MDRFLEFLDYQDFSAVFLVLCLLTMVGRVMASDDQDVRQWAARVAALAMIGHAALLTVGWRPTAAATIAAIVFRALLTGGLALAVAQIVLSVLASANRLAIRPLVSRHRQRRFTSQQRAARRREQRQADEARRLSQAEWERAAPARQQAQQQAEQKARCQAEAAAARARIEAGHQKRREDSRAAVEFLYALYKPEIKPRFSQKQFDEFSERCLTDRHSADYVEQPAEQMRLMIQSHLEKGRPAPAKFQTLDDVTRWYEEQQREIAGMPDGKMKTALLARLREKYSDLSFQVLGED